ncbi:MAG: nickel pincer cofactor biosynthesis protein LarC [Pseudomonadota bacterium]
MTARNIGYFDCPAGASGDMIMGAFLDAGLPLDFLRDELARLELPGWELESFPEMKQGVSARRFVVKIAPQHHHRRMSDIRRIIRDSGLAPAVKDLSLAVFDRLAQAEGRVHGRDPEEVHFHEVGAVDSIIDIVGAAIAFQYFELDDLHVSPLPLASGWVMTAHGRLPLPAPAALLLLEGVPVRGTELESELVTPTGAAVLTAFAAAFGPWPDMTIRKIGHGAGARDLPDRPNIIRLALGLTGLVGEAIIEAEANIDDMNPEIYPYVVDRLLAAGALDAWLTPIQMKKGRPGVKLAFLARRRDLEKLTGLVLAETSTLGVRHHSVDRRTLPRAAGTVDTPWGPAKVKVIQREGRREVAPEFETCRELAEKHGLPLLEIYRVISDCGK